MKITFLAIAGFMFLIMFIFVMTWVIGVSQAKADYKKEYKQLKMYVRNSLLTKPYHEFIRDKFKEIRRFRCRDEVKLRELEREFYERFKNV